MTRQEQPKSFIFHGAGGAMDGSYVLSYLLYLSKHTGLEPHQLFDFFIGESISSLFVAALNTKHPNKPGRAFFTTQELSDMFYAKASELLPYQGWRGYLKVLFKSQASYVDKRTLERSLHSVFGDMRMGDAIKGSMITSQKVFPGPRLPHHFTHIPEGLLSEANFPMPSMVESAELSVHQAILSSMAHAGFIGSHEIEATGTVHTDLASLANRAAEVIHVAKRLKSEVKPVYCYFGTGIRNSHGDKDTIAKADRSGLLSFRKLSFLQEGGTADAKFAQIEAIRAALGPETVRVLEMDMDNPPEGLHVPNNLIDSRPEAMEQRRVVAEAFIRANRVMFERFGDQLGENHALKTAVQDPTAALARIVENPGANELRPAAA